MKADKKLDCAGFFCPLPVVKTKLMLEEMKAGEILELTADDPGAEKDIPVFCRETGNELLRNGEENGNFIFYIRKKGGESA